MDEKIKKAEERLKKIYEDGEKYELECSADHPILTKNRGYIRADSLTIDDDIVIHR